LKGGALPSHLSIEIPTVGAVAQLGERVNGIHEVSGSIPLGSTNHLGFGFCTRCSFQAAWKEQVTPPAAMQNNASASRRPGETDEQRHRLAAKTSWPCTEGR
jgi:hypothetical protein